MNTLGPNKPIFLNQVKTQKPGVEKLIQLLKFYNDLEIEDLKGYVDDATYSQLEEFVDPRDPTELAAWNEASQAYNMATTVDAMKAAKQQLQNYIGRFPSGPCVKEAQEIIVDLDKRMLIVAEQEQWLILDKNNYNALLNYKNRHPESAHLAEIDDLMWACTCAAGKVHDFERYLAHWPSGQHAEEAKIALKSLSEWERIKREGDIFEVALYRNENPSSPFKQQIDLRYFDLCDLMLEKMKKKPWEFSSDETMRLINDGIYTKWTLMDEGLITEWSWDIMTNFDRSMLPNIQDLQQSDPYITVPEGTDVYLFGTPGTGKTCLLMGLTGANGFGYTLNMKVGGGQYASALQQYIHTGITPGSTFGSFVTAINGTVNEQKRNEVVPHPINLVEMSGEEFATRIADNQEVSLADMGTGATNLMQNDNRKVFFIIVDATTENVKFQYVEKIQDAEGNIIEERIRRRNISQLDILNKFVSLFVLPENQDIMSKVDAIHFVVTKADTLGDNQEERLNNAYNLLTTRYMGPVQMLKDYCQRTRRINLSSNYKPLVFTFSLGKFYLGDIFSFDNTETLQIIDVIRKVTMGKRQDTFWTKLTKMFN